MNWYRCRFIQSIGWRILFTKLTAEWWVRHTRNCMEKMVPISPNLSVRRNLSERFTWGPREPCSFLYWHAFVACQLVCQNQTCHHTPFDTVAQRCWMTWHRNKLNQIPPYRIAFNRLPSHCIASNCIASESNRIESNRIESNRIDPIVIAGRYERHPHHFSPWLRSHLIWSVLSMYSTSTPPTPSDQ